MNKVNERRMRVDFNNTTKTILEMLSVGKIVNNETSTIIKFNELIKAYSDRYKLSITDQFHSVNILDTINNVLRKKIEVFNDLFANNLSNTFAIYNKIKSHFLFLYKSNRIYHCVPSNSDLIRKHCTIVWRIIELSISNTVYNYFLSQPKTNIIAELDTKINTIINEICDKGVWEHHTIPAFQNIKYETIFRFDSISYLAKTKFGNVHLDVSTIPVFNSDEIGFKNKKSMQYTQLIIEVTNPIDNGTHFENVTIDGKPVYIKYFNDDYTKVRKHMTFNRYIKTLMRKTDQYKKEQANFRYFY